MELGSSGGFQIIRLSRPKWFVSKILDFKLHGCGNTYFPHSLQGSSPVGQRETSVQPGDAECEKGRSNKMRNGIYHFRHKLSVLKILEFFDLRKGDAKHGDGHGIPASVHHAARNPRTLHRKGAYYV